MAKKKERERRAKEEARPELPPGVKLLRTLEGHVAQVNSVTFDHSGRALASGSADGTVKLWDVTSGVLLRTFERQKDVETYKNRVYGVAFEGDGRILASGAGSDRPIGLWDTTTGKLLRILEPRDTGETLSLALADKRHRLASGSSDGRVKLWDAASGKLLRMLEPFDDSVLALTFDREGYTLASGSASTVKLWEAISGKLLGTLEGHNAKVLSVAFDIQGRTLASSSVDRTIKLWNVPSGKLVRTLEGHSRWVDVLAFSADGLLLASKSGDGTIRIWNCQTWETVAVILEPTNGNNWIPALAFHPTLPLLATAGSEPGTPERERSLLVHLWELDLDILLGQRFGTATATRAVHHTTGKIVLVGDHSVGKSALGYRLVHGHFEKQESTHGQQFWVFPDLGKRRADGTDCEAVLWDFAGQPDYRLVHALFVDNADLALVLFDASDLRDPLHGVGFWLKQLRTGQSACPIILVAAQTDRGVCSLTPEELAAFCEKNGVVGPIATSAATGLGLAELVERMKSLIPWEDKAATVTTTTFKRIKDYVLGLKGMESGSQIIVTPQELRRLLEATDVDWVFTDAEMLTAVGHLENYGYVKRLRTSKCELRVLLQPERLNNLASSLVLEARRNPKGLGALEEKRLLAGGYEFPELRDLPKSERDVLLDSAALLFLEHNVCFRETDPLRLEPYLVFPELINLKKPPQEEESEEGVAYTVTGPTENVFASLVVLLGYTHTFTRTAQWKDNARYEVGDGLVCGFRQEAERDGELDFVLSFGPKVGPPVRTLFQGLFESFLTRRNLTVLRYEPVRCSKDHPLNRAVVREALQHGQEIAFCSKCGEQLTLPKMAEPIQLTREQQTQVDTQRRSAEQRTRFEQAVFRLRAYVAEQETTPPETFISYAWGEPEHERWVEKRLATDLQKAGIVVVLDRWDNAQIGSNVARFVERIKKSDRIVLVGTPLYRRKYENEDTHTGYVVAAEVDLINRRLLGTEPQKRTVLPLLLTGEESESFPPLLEGRVYGDFRKDEAYFAMAFDLILDVYGISHQDAAVADLRESLRGSELR